jgi:hypothetical protein
MTNINDNKINELINIFFAQDSERNKLSQLYNLFSNDIITYTVNSIKNNSITKLDLYNCNKIFDDDNKIKLFYDALKHNTSITCIYSFVSLNKRILNTVAEVLKVTNTIKGFHLISNREITYWINTISAALEKNTSLTKLCISHSETTDDDVKVLFNALKFNKTLIKIDLGMNKITDIGINYLCKLLKYNTTLTHIELAMNNITDIGISYLCKLLKYNTTLTDIDIKDNLITDNGIILIAKYLKRNHNIKNIKFTHCLYRFDQRRNLLSSNQPIHIGFAAICNSLHKNTNLKSLHIHYNEQCAIYLANMLRVNTTLQTIRLINYNSPLTNTDIELIYDAVITNNSITNISLNKMPYISPEIGKICEKNAHNLKQRTMLLCDL